MLLNTTRRKVNSDSGHETEIWFGGVFVCASAHIGQRSEVTGLPLGNVLRRPFMSDQQQIFTGRTNLSRSLKEGIKAERNAEMRNQRSGT